MSNPMYKWVFNTSTPRPDSLDLSFAGCRSKIGVGIDGDPDQRGIYIHRDDLEKTARYYKDMGMLAEAQFVREAIQAS